MTYLPPDTPETPVPPDDKYIISSAYAAKYGVPTNVVSGACIDKALICEKRVYQRMRNGRKIGMRSGYFVLDIPPHEHPGWQARQERLKKRKGGASNRAAHNSYDANMQHWAPIFLERFDAARMKVDHTRFPLREVAEMLDVERMIVARWSDVGVEGYGKLPRIHVPSEKMEYRDSDGNYHSIDGTSHYFYDTKDIRRWLKGELVNPKARFNTWDDKTSDSNVDEIAEKHGFFVYRPEKAYPATYEGFLKWCSDNVVIQEKKHSRRKRRFVPMERQRELYKNAFSINPKTGDFRYRCICISRPRGEFKSFDACLLFLFRFFNMPEEMIFLVANSEKQTTHLLFNEAVKIIKRSPNLLATNGLEIQAKGIYLMSDKKTAFSQIEVMSAESGTRSNATCFAFSEVYKLANETAFAEIDGSIRAVPNAWTIIESTVAPKGHFFHRLYEASLRPPGDPKHDPVLYFQYYNRDHGFMNPETTREQLAHYELTMMPGDFAMFYGNKWEDAGSSLFDPQRIAEVGYIGIDGIIGPSPELSAACDKMVELDSQIRKLHGATDTSNLQAEMSRIKARLRQVDDIYSLPANSSTLEKLSQMLNCEWILGVGLDRAIQISRRSDRTVLATVAKGILDEHVWICFVLDIFMPADPTLEAITNRIVENSQTFGWIDYIDIEDYQGKDIHGWCIEKGFRAELVKPTYAHQQQMFSTVHALFTRGLLKCPTVPIWSDQKDRIYHQEPPDGIQDILRSEMGDFEHWPAREGRLAGWFGAKTKQKTGRTLVGSPKDDVIFALAHAINAANRGDIVASEAKMPFASAQINTDVIGEYGIE